MMDNNVPLQSQTRQWVTALACSLILGGAVVYFS